MARASSTTPASGCSASPSRVSACCSAAVHAATGADLPRLGSAVYAAALVALAVLLLLDARARAPAALGGTLVLASSYVWTNHGSAATLVLALLAAAALASRRRPALAGLLAGAAAWCRPDALAGAALLGLLVWWEERRFPRRYALAAGAVVAAGLLAAWTWFGTPLPETAAAKRADAFAATGGGVEAARFFWQRAARLAPRHFGAWWGWLLALGAAGLVPFWRRERPRRAPPRALRRRRGARLHAARRAVLLLVPGTARGGAPLRPRGGAVRRRAAARRLAARRSASPRRRSSPSFSPGPSSARPGPGHAASTATGTSTPTAAPAPGCARRRRRRPPSPTSRSASSAGRASAGSSI